MQKIICEESGRMRRVLLPLALLLCAMSRVTGSEPRIQVPGLHQECYQQNGDLMLGVLTPIHRASDSTEFCTDSYFGTLITQLTEAYVYAVNKVNANNTLLPNITLGFYILDDCFWDMAALSKALYFVPVTGDPEEPMNDLEDTTASASWDVVDADSGSSLNISSAVSSAQVPTADPSSVGNECMEGVRQYSVVGVTGLSNSRKAVMVSSLLGVFHIPIIGTLATSDELSDKSRYEYFLRVVPPDIFQAEAILDFISDLGWTYISLVYTEGSYGENGAKQIERNTPDRGMCIAYSEMIDIDAEQKVVEKIFDDLLKFEEARVVVLFVSYEHAEMLYQIVEERSLHGKFIWVGGDAIGIRLPMGETSSLGTFALKPVFGSDPDFDEYYRHLTPDNNPANPWMKDHWEALYGCSWDPEPVGLSCWNLSDVPATDQTVTTLVYKSIDSIYTYAHALDALIRENCPQAFIDSSYLSGCIEGHELLSYLKNTSFDGVTGPIKFDSAGNMLGRYDLVQHGTHGVRHIALWDSDREAIDIDYEAVDWALFFQEGPDQSSGDRESPDGNHSVAPDVPISECSQPCGRRQYYIMKELECCWECYSCRDNEILINNNTGCRVCPANTWPDLENATTCLDIPPTFLRWSDPLSAVLVALALAGVVVWVTSSCIYIRHWDARLVKASSRQLSVVILIGILLAYLSVFVFIGRPLDTLCSVQRYSFNLAVTLIYAPLLMKTSRVYRIFAAGKKGKQKPALTSNTAQTAMTACLVIIQVALSVVTAVIVPPQAVLRMRVPTEEYVELFCDWPLEGFLVTLSFNLVLIIATGGYGFMVRKLPENFNESWYIFVSVATTTFLWVVFLPTYFTTFYAHHQSALLASCLIINATVTVLCLYMPKFYALYFVDEERMVFLHATTNNSVAPVSHPSHNQTD